MAKHGAAGQYRACQPRPQSYVEGGGKQLLFVAVAGVRLLLSVLLLMMMMMMVVMMMMLMLMLRIHCC